MRIVHTSSHWGAVEAVVENGRVVRILPFRRDPDPSPIIQSLGESIYHPLRITEPMVRKSWLRNGHKNADPRDGTEAFVRVSWTHALELVRSELSRVAREHGNASIYGGTYGWGSAGRLHCAPTLLRRFLRLIGGYTSSVDSYSCAAAIVLMPHVLGDFYDVSHNMTDWRSIADACELFVAFGGVPIKNAQVVAGGCGEHTARHWLMRCADRGVQFVNVSPIRSDVPDFAKAEWLVLRPGSDVALMLAIAFVLLDENLYDSLFVRTHCTGFEEVRSYLQGERDNVPKAPDWAAGITGVPACTIAKLARRMARHRTMISLSWSVQRADGGELVYWSAITLAAMLGQIGLPGGGIGFGYAAVGNSGQPADAESRVRISAGRNPIGRFIPVARITDMLERPGGVIDYNGRKIEFPDTRLIYWCGGNPFHHHQDLNRLCRAWRHPETVIVHEPWWTPLARRADIVLPASTSFERNDIGGSTRDPYILAMRRAIEPVGVSRSDFDIFSELAEGFRAGDVFTEGRDELDWIRHFYASDRSAASAKGIDLPEFQQFWEQGYAYHPIPEKPAVLFEDFRNAPSEHPLATPSGRVELFSRTIASFGYEDCPGQAVWREPVEWLGSALAERFPLHLISNQPRTRLHSQLDPYGVSAASKVAGREPIWLNPEDASARGISDGDLVEVFNDRGRCLAGAIVSDDLSRSIVQMATGAWMDIDTDEWTCLAGNVNLLTPDRGTSSLAQGPSAHSCLVEVARFKGEAPKSRAFEPPVIERSEPAVRCSGN